MKPTGPVFLLLVGLVLGWISISTDDPTFQIEPERELPRQIPYALSGEVPSGCVVRQLELEGICCKGCVGKLYVALSDVDEVQEAAIDPVLARAEAVVPADLDVALLESALTFDKYSAAVSEDEVASH